MNPSDYLDAYSKVETRDERRAILEQSYRDAIDPNMAGSEAITYHLHNLVGHAMTLAGLIILRGENELSVGIVTDIDLFDCIEICVAHVQQLLNQDSLSAFSGNNVKAW